MHVLSDFLYILQKGSRKMHKKTAAENAIQAIAAREGVTVEEARAHIQLAIRAGMRNPDPAIRTEWQKIPCEGDMPTPEEFILYVAERVRA